MMTIFIFRVKYHFNVSYKPSTLEIVVFIYFWNGAVVIYCKNTVVITFFFFSVVI